MLYAYLCSFDDGVPPSTYQMIRQLGIGKTRFYRYRNELEAFGLIEVENKITSGGGVAKYGYNPCSVKYDTTTRSSVLDTSYNWSTDADLGTALDLSALYPQDEVVKYGTKLTFAGPWSAWCEDAGKTRCVSSTPGVYATSGASGSPILSATIKGNTTVYVDWPWSGYDGVMSARS